jgi:ThiF family/Prokaryotic homologs of the JAB domain
VTLMDVTLSLSSLQHRMLRNHLFPGDGKEAAAIVLCGRRAGHERYRLLGQKVYLIPHEACFERSSVSIKWATDLMVPWLQEADKLGLSVVKVHSHPTGFAAFSAQDDQSDGDLFPCVADWVAAEVPHASVVMLPDGRMFGRAMTGRENFERLRLVAVVGDDLFLWRPYDFGHEPAPGLGEFTRRHAKAFGEKTTRALRELRVAVIGCSGTGSPLVAQLAHLGVAMLVLVDPDKVHELNLNRIYYATIDDARAQRFKVDVLGEAVERIGLGTVVRRYPINLYNAIAVGAVAECDIVFGCVDTAEGRFLLNLLCNFYTLPYIDLGVTLEADDTGEITQVCGYLHYLQPGGSSLLSRDAFTLDDVSAEGTKRQNPTYYEEQRKAGYIKGVDEDRPAVISVNTQFASLAINELIARLHPFREKGNHAYAKIGLSLSEMAFYPEAEPPAACRYMSRQVGKGDVVPLLNMPELSVEASL